MARVGAKIVGEDAWRLSQTHVTGLNVSSRKNKGHELCYEGGLCELTIER